MVLGCASFCMIKPIIKEQKCEVWDLQQNYPRNWWAIGCSADTGWETVSGEASNSSCSNLSVGLTSKYSRQLGQ